jgi:uncharacterized membrane protein (UPF0127 family)
MPMSRGRIAIASVALLAIVAVTAVALAGDEDGGSDRARGPIVTVGEASVRAEVADDAASLERGLSGRDRLGADDGMLFLLPDDSPAFWMKGMRFPLDIVWIKHGRVVDVTADVPPPSGPGASLPTYSPARPADRVLEVNAGWAARHGVGRGDAVRVRRAGGG